MRKWFFAGAVVGGFLLLGAAPAHADLVPVTPGELIAPVGAGAAQGLGLDPANGLNLESPLGGPLAHLKPGQNSVELPAGASDLTRPTRPAPHTGGASSRPAAQPPRESKPPRKAASFEGGLPLLGGLGGLLPANEAPAHPAASGLPAGGTPVPADKPRSFSDEGRPVEG